MAYLIFSGNKAQYCHVTQFSNTAVIHSLVSPDWVQMFIGNESSTELYLKLLYKELQPNCIFKLMSS